MSGHPAPARVARMTTDNTTHTGDAPYRPCHQGEVAQLMLPGQAAAADGPLDMTMMYAMHHAFRRDLRALTRAATVTPLGDRIAWRELDRPVGVVRLRAAPPPHRRGRGLLAAPDRPGDRCRATGPGRHGGRAPPHRPRARAVRRPLPAPDLRPRPDRASVPGPGAGTCPVAARGPPGARGARGHPADAALRHPGEEDEHIEREHFRAGIPLRRVLEVVPWVLHELPAQARDRVLDLAGPAYRGMWVLTLGGFARRDRRAMRHA